LFQSSRVPTSHHFTSARCGAGSSPPFFTCLCRVRVVHALKLIVFTFSVPCCDVCPSLKTPLQTHIQIYTSFKQQSFRILPSNELFKYVGINRGKWFLFKLLFVNIGLDAINMGNILAISVNSQFFPNFKVQIVPIIAGTYITYFYGCHMWSKTCVTLRSPVFAPIYLLFFVGFVLFMLSSYLSLRF